MAKKFYLSTAIAYTSSTPHIGNVYEAILADAICRNKRKEGYDVYFQTGTDEHGQKIERKALSLGITPQAHVDKVSKELRDIYDLMNVTYDKFVRTTDKEHMRVVQDIYQKLYDNGDIYKSSYEGYYCVACESYYTEKALVDGKCPECGAKVEKSKEESYFLRLKPYQERLINHIKTHPDFIQPESRKNEMLNNFLKEDLPDLCVSRSTFKWGVPLPFDPKHVSYVWIDALSNYITGIGYDLKNPSKEFKKLWPADIHLIGKDILRFHTIYWPIILMALGLELPKQIFGHPWVLFGNDKMSKSKGNVMYASDLVDLFGVDAVRYYVLHEIPFAQDGSITYDLIADRYNSDLANTYGNLVSRSISMTKKYFDGTVSYKGELTQFDKELKEELSKTLDKYKKSMDALKVCDAAESVMTLLRRANKYVDETEPWVLAKDEAKKDTLENVLYYLLEVIREASILLEPFMPSTSEKVYKFLNVNNNSYESLNKFDEKGTYTVGEAEILFKRLDLKELEEKVLKIKEKLAPKKEEKMEEKVELKEEITIDDFDKVELVVGQIEKCEKHPNADKLLVSQVNIGTEVRQIVSGIAKWYKPEDLVGKKVIVVKNLKPVELRKVKSSGMLLCASDKDDNKLELIEIKALNPGDIIR